LELSNRRLEKYLYLVEGVGAVFVAFFLVAYLGGLPTTNVLHALPEFRIPLFVFGAVLVELIVGGVVVAALLRPKGSA
jgi:hypothetical protein